MLSQVEEGSLRHDVQVVYGADLPTLKHGSGFATDSKDPYRWVVFTTARACGILTSNRCSTHPWNLNVMPTLSGSLLRHLSRKVSGLVAPWLYIGMLFSAFCWHNEDNYLYSINYMHWGGTKTWYAHVDLAEQTLQLRQLFGCTGMVYLAVRPKSSKKSCERALRYLCVAIVKLTAI